MEEFEKKVPLLPPDFDLDDYFDLVDNRKNRLKSLIKIEAPDVIVTEEKRLLREAVDKLLAYLDKIENNIQKCSPTVKQKMQPPRKENTMCNRTEQRTRKMLYIYSRFGN